MEFLQIAQAKSLDLYRKHFQISLKDNICTFYNRVLDLKANDFSLKRTEILPVKEKIKQPIRLKKPDYLKLYLNKLLKREMKGAKR